MDQWNHVLLGCVLPNPTVVLTDKLAGIVTIAMGFVTNLAGLAACRVLLGLFEAGFVPG
jgi:MFS family permease